MKALSVLDPVRSLRRHSALTLAALLCAVTLLPLVGCASGAPEAKTAPDEQAEEREPSGNKSMAQALDEIYGEAEPGEVDEEPGGQEKGERATGQVIDYPQPPDGKWLTDDQGRKYYVAEIPKVEGHYVRLDDGRIRGLRGVPMDLAGETDETFQVKIYHVEPVERKREEPPSAEEIAAVEAAYTADLPAADLLDFEDFGDGLPQTGQWRNGFDVADMNGDGHADIVHGTPRRGQRPPVIFLGDGRGTWTFWEEAVFPPAPYDYGDVTAADFDQDGHMDVGLAIHLSGLLVLVGDGQGAFEPWSDGLHLNKPGQGDRPEHFLSRTVSSTDWNQDGLPDLLALSEGPRHPKATERGQVETPFGLMIYLNQGDGSWVRGHHLAGKDEIFGDSLVTGDFDGDGIVDAVTGSNAIGQRRLLHLNGPNGQGRAVEIDSIRPQSFVWAVDAADFDGDGLLDLAVGTSGLDLGLWWSALDVLLARQADDGSLSYERRALAGGRDGEDQRVTAIGAGDLDGDGNADLVAATGDGRLRVFVGDGRGGFTENATGPLDTPRPSCRGYHVMLANLDGRPGDEVVAAFAGEQCAGTGSLGAWSAVRK